jgi:nucleotide-binding universal stress UspA family protein
VSARPRRDRLRDAPSPRRVRRAWNRAAVGSRVLIAFDGSDGARAAVRAAGALFPGLPAIVVCVHDARSDLEHAAALTRIALPDATILRAVAELDEAGAQRAVSLAKAGADLAREHGLDATAEAEPGHGSPWHGICEAARRHDATVIACGTRGLGGIQRALLGSTSSALVHHAPVPLLVVPEGADAHDGPVLVGYDGSDAARDAVALAAHLLRPRELVVVNVWESPLRHSHTGRAFDTAPIPEFREIAAELDEYFASIANGVAEAGAEPARGGGVKTEAVTFEAAGAPWHGLLTAARDRGAAVVVVGSRGRGGVTASLLGSVSSGLVHNADLPVLVSRP